MSISDNKEISIWNFVFINGSSKHVVLKCLDGVSRHKGSKEGRGVGVGQLPILVGGGLGILSWFLYHRRNYTLMHKHILRESYIQYHSNMLSNLIRILPGNINSGPVPLFIYQLKNIIVIYLTYSFIIILYLCCHADLHQ